MTIFRVAATVAAWSTACAISIAQPVQAILMPTQDAFAREAQPDTNYGSAGALAVAGSSAVNGVGVPQGRYDSVMQFEAAPLVSIFNNAFGPERWKISGVSVVVSEVSFANNFIFNRGLGSFQIRWLSDDNWVGGPGTPQFPVVGTGNQMTWNLLQSILAGATEANLGNFMNTLTDSFVTSDLALDPALVNELMSGSTVSLHFAPVTPEIGFTFHSSNYAGKGAQPFLRVSAVWRRGDLNCDTQFNLADMAAFVLALVDPTAYAMSYANCEITQGDMNDDGLINGADIQAFVDALLN